MNLKVPVALTHTTAVNRALARCSGVPRMVRASCSNM